MKAFRGAKRTTLPVSAQRLSPRNRMVELMELIDHPEKYRKAIQAILQIRRTSLFGKVRNEFYDLGNPVVVLTRNTTHEFSAAYSFERVDCKVNCTGISVRIYIEGRLVTTRSLQEQELLGGQDSFEFTYNVNPGVV